MVGIKIHKNLSKESSDYRSRGKRNELEFRTWQHSGRQMKGTVMMDVGVGAHRAHTQIEEKNNKRPIWKLRDAVDIRGE